MPSKGIRRKAPRQHGFTMIEMMVSVAILTLVIAVVVDGLTRLQNRNKVETSKVDLTQEVRQFEDQIVSDIHQSGYPPFHSFDPAVYPTKTACDSTMTAVACGLVSVTTSSIQFEGDVDGSGTVSEVFIQLVQNSGTSCPCTIQRGTESKAQWNSSGRPPVYYTEVNNVSNSNIFAGYDNGGNSVTLSSTGAPPANLDALEITLNVQAPVPDTNGSYPQITMSTGVKIHNFD